MSLATRRPVSRAVTFLRSLVSVYRKRDVPFMAGSIAYAAFVSLVPLLLLALVAASVLGGESLQQQLLSMTEQYLTPTARDLVSQSLDGAQSRTQFSIIGGAALLWATLKVFRSLDTAFSELYAVETDVGIVEQVSDGLLVLGGMGVAFLAMVAAGAVVAYAPTFSPGVETRLPVVQILGFVGLILGLIVAFLPMYYVFPNVEMTLTRALPGATVAAVGWTLLQALFQVYVSMSSTGELYGVLGGIILLITWLYFGSVVILLGGATNVVLSGRHRIPGYDAAT
ncbi:YihY/virulence factor BrkB family protein [Halosimplex halobium]|uniref:YihY/virulence factor BrkB family protein n=1 Tax=Halosimplex halobium TaxID=3396618 RepID=UPI003F55A604